MNIYTSLKPCPILICTVVLMAGCHTKSHDSSGHINSYDQLKRFFADPPSEYRSAPLWDWNDKITVEGIDYQMEKFKEGGLGGVFVHPRPGLITEYLSQDWDSLFDHTVRKGAELGLNVWIYDENSYPSGFAGGHVPAEMPESYSHGTGMTCDVQNTLNPDTATYDLVLKQENDGFRDITANMKPETGKTGVYYLFKKTYGQKSYWYGNYPYVDLLYKGVTRKFIDITMKGYEKYNQADMGKTLKGIFTDEPNLEAAMGPNSVIRWTPDLFDEFRKRWNYDLKVNLPSLVAEIGNWKKIRHDYYEVILEMFLDRWSKPWNKYTEEKGLAWTGHYWEHGWPAPTEGIDEASFYIFHQQPGIDMLGNELIAKGQGGQFGNTRAVRELRSAANQGGHIRTLSETYGGAGWEINFTNFKRLVDWEEVLGVNFVNQHLSYYTIKGVRKFDYPPSFSYHEPWWKSYKFMGDYIGRISMAMLAGQQVNKILVLQPNTTAWMYFSRKVKNAMVDSIQKSFKGFVYRLERNHIEYDLGSEHVLKMLGSVKKDKLIVGERAYEWVVIPVSMSNIDRSTYDLLKNYLAHGGRILSFTRDIPFLDGQEGSEVNDLMKAFPSGWTFAQENDDQKIKELFRQTDFSVSDMDQAGGELYFQRRMMEDGQLLFFVNTDSLRHATAAITARGAGLVRMDLNTGKCYRIPGKSENGTISFHIDIPQVGSALYYLSDNTVSETPESIPEGTEQPVNPDADITVNPENENILVLNYMDVKSKSIDLKEVYFMKAMHALFDSNGFIMGNPWQHKIQYRQDYLALDTFRQSSAFEINYHFQVASGAELQSLTGLSAVVERPELWDIYLNGKKLSQSDSWWIDRDFHRFPLESNVRKGENILTLKAPKMSVYAELMPAYILGNFILNPVNKGFEITSGQMTRTGSWKDLGYPFYGQDVLYTQKFKVTNRGSQYKVKMKHWNGTLAEVFVNGKSAGSILWPPYELTVDSLKAGDNEIAVRVTGSLKNTFGYFYKPNRQWINGPGDWDTAPSGIPSSDKYFLMDYGLFEPFSLVMIK